MQLLAAIRLQNAAPNVALAKDLRGRATAYALSAAEEILAGAEFIHRKNPDAMAEYALIYARPTPKKPAAPKQNAEPTPTAPELPTA